MAISLKQIFQALSVMFHPILMPTYGILLLLSIDSYLALDFDTTKSLFLILAIVIYTVVAPVVSILLLLYSMQRSIKGSIEMRDAQTRTIPFILTAIYYIMAYIMVLRFNVPHVISAMVLGAIICLVMAILINLRWKISVHMIGLGGITGALIAFSEIQGIYLLHLLVPVIFISGLVGTARLYNQAHQPLQVYAGFIIGCLCEYLIVRQEWVV